MATRDTQALDRTLAALADPTRRAMVERLAKNGRMAISDLATPFAMSLPAVLKHVGVLISAGLVSRVKVGRTVYCHLLSPSIRSALAWLRKYEDYQVPADAGASKAAPVVARKQKGKPDAARGKRAATKTKPKSASRAPAGAQQSKAKAAGRRAKAAPATPAGQRGGRPLAETRRARTPGKAPVVTARGRPRR